MPFATLAQRPPLTIFPGVNGHLVHLDRLTVGEVTLADGAIVTTHQHPHEQVSYVLSGRVEFTVGGETRVLEAGQCALIPGGTPHHVRALTAGRVLDIFSPVREDFRSAARP
jgi:quercetin dioxygenase-like cupin family protein